MSREKTLVVILCMHRCGSSLTARFLQRLGMSLGPFDLGECNESNKYGHFEAQPFVLLNRAFQMRQFGFEGDLPEDDDVLRRYCQCDGRWTSEDTITEEALARGRDLVVGLMQSGDVCGFKDPRTVLVWPYWRRVFASMPELRIVPLFLVRGPHEIAMSIFRRSRGERDYAQALDISAVHFRRMKEILDQWPGRSAVVQFDPQVCRRQSQAAAELCGLTWSDAAFAEVYDASCRHHEVTAIDHPAQAAFETLTGLCPDPVKLENYRQLLADAAVREEVLRQRPSLVRAERDAARKDAALLYEDNVALRSIAASLQARLAKATFELGLIYNSRTWRVREALANALRLGHGGKGSADPASQDISISQCSDGQDSLSRATGRHYRERKTHAGD